MDKNVPCLFQSKVMTAIFSCLSASDKSRCASVCKTWRDALADATVWRHTVVPWRKGWASDPAALEGLGKRKIQRVSVDIVFEKDNDEWLLDIATALPKVTSLEFTPQRCCNVTLNPSLLARVMQLTTLTIAGNSRVTEDGVDVITRNLKCLIRLELTGFVVDESLRLIASRLQHLKHLVLWTHQVVTSDGIGYLTNHCASPSDFIARLPKLETFELRNNHRLRDSALQFLCDGQPLLKHLRLLFAVTNTGLYHLSKLVHLQELKIHGYSTISNEGIIHLSKLSNLRDLSLAAASDFTVSAEGLLYLTKLTSLRYLQLVNFGDVGETGWRPLTMIPALLKVTLLQSSESSPDSSVKTIHERCWYSSCGNRPPELQYCYCSSISVSNLLQYLWSLNFPALRLW